MSEKSKSCGVCDFETEESYMGLGMCMGIAAGMFIQQVVFKGDTYIGMLIGSGSLSDSCKPSGSLMPQTVPFSL